MAVASPLGSTKVYLQRDLPVTKQSGQVAKARG